MAKEDIGKQIKLYCILQDVLQLLTVLCIITAIILLAIAMSKTSRADDQLDKAQHYSAEFNKQHSNYITDEEQLRFRQNRQILQNIEFDDRLRRFEIRQRRLEQDYREEENEN